MTLNPFTRLACALLVALPVAAYAESGDTPPLPVRNPSRQPAPSHNPDRAELPAAEHPLLPGDAPTVTWTEREVAAAKADCAKLLAGLALEYEPLPPLREGICGAPAPIRVTSIGSDPKVEIDPPAIVTCAVAAGVGRWLSKTVQPNARALIGAPVVRLQNASSYVCRNRYNGTDTLLSEHALANALDVSEFVFQSGEKVTVLASWPHVVTAPPPPVPNPVRVADTSSDDTTSSISSISTTSVGHSIVKAIKAKAKAVPKPPPVAEPPQADRSPDAKSDFVRTVHDDACAIFGTVLGPDSNAAHKNHFHLDMKKRRRSAFCE